MGLMESKRYKKKMFKEIIKKREITKSKNEKCIAKMECKDLKNQ